jgi:tetratricopeptide (TPR) repeat protein
MLFRVGRTLLDNRNVRQAAREFARCAELAPDWLEPRLWLAASYLSASDFARAFAEAENIQTSLPPRDGEQLSQLLFCRTTALQGLGRTVEANACLGDFLREHRQEDDLLSAAAELYSENARPEEALLLLNSLIQHKPDSPQFLVRKAFAQLQLSRCDDAIDSLTAALSFAPPDTRLHRALASVLAGQFQAVRGDSQELLRAAGNTRNLLFGLGEIAWSKHDTNATIALYRQCLSSDTPGSSQYALVTKRLEQIGATYPGQRQQTLGR